MANTDMATLMAQIEIEMMSDMYNKITATCHKKCISSKYREPDLSKGEAICLDRCVAKWTEIHEKIGHKLVAATTENVDAQKMAATIPNVPS